MEAAIAAPLQGGTEVDDRSRRLVTIASLIGTTVEWYDFFLYGTITGLVFNKLFFPADNVFVSTMLAYTVYAMGFVTRPVGGILFGHFGDKIGRKPLLVMTLLIMGISTFLVGLVPTYASIGVAAPLLLLTLRLLQGIGIGGEWGGAVIMSFEYAPRESPRLLRVFSASGPGDRIVSRHRRRRLAVVLDVRRSVPVLGMAQRVPAVDRPGRRRHLRAPQDLRDAGIRAHQESADDRQGRRWAKCSATTRATCCWDGALAGSTASCSTSTPCSRSPISSVR